MKWIEISKAKPNFEERYLIFSADMHVPHIGKLEETSKRPDGIYHRFVLEDGETVTIGVKAAHIALITLPGEK